MVIHRRVYIHTSHVTLFLTVCTLKQELNVPPAKSYQPTSMKPLHGNTVQKTPNVSYICGIKVSLKLKCKHCNVNVLHSFTTLAIQKNIISQMTSAHVHTYKHTSGASNENLANILLSNVLQTGSVQFI